MAKARRIPKDIGAGLSEEGKLMMQANWLMRKKGGVAVDWLQELVTEKGGYVDKDGQIKWGAPPTEDYEETYEEIEVSSEVADEHVSGPSLSPLRVLVYILIAFSWLVQAGIYLGAFGYLVWLVMEVGPVGLVAIIPLGIGVWIFMMIWGVIGIGIAAIAAKAFEE